MTTENYLVQEESKEASGRKIDPQEEYFAINQISTKQESRTRKDK